MGIVADYEEGVKDALAAPRDPNLKPQVFLGGSCNPTTWRADVAIPELDAAGVAYYNPQVDDWSPELAAVETAAKATSAVLLFVVDSKTRAITAILEATEYTVAGRLVVLAVEDVPDGTVIRGQKVTGEELKDLNRARAYLRELAGRYVNAHLFGSVEKAVRVAAREAAELAAAPTA